MWVVQHINSAEGLFTDQRVLEVKAEGYVGLSPPHEEGRALSTPREQLRPGQAPGQPRRAQRRCVSGRGLAAGLSAVLKTLLAKRGEK